MQELPTGLQVFEHIRSAGALYVDKTDMIHKIVSGARMQFFISRPRRFGKTLLCWTLNALFSVILCATPAISKPRRRKIFCIRPDT
ncbi:MAG: AAA family ATPase [Chitinispirillales bacterium]|jgi:hypothetical protein|nr:AAA family ATPase [Chitinispirillales bacterium]